MNPMTDFAPVADEHKLDVRHAGAETVGIDHREGAIGNPVIRTANLQNLVNNNARRIFGVLAFSVTLLCIGILTSRIPASWLARCMCPRHLLLKFATETLLVVRHITSFLLSKTVSGLILLSEAPCVIDNALFTCAGVVRIWAKYNGIALNEQLGYMRMVLFALDCVPYDRKMERTAPAAARMTVHFASILASCSTILGVRALRARDFLQARVHQMDLDIADLIRLLSKSILLLYIFAPENANLVTVLALTCLVRARYSLVNR